MTNIVIADDNRLVRKILISILESEPDLKVIGEARDGFEAVRLVKSLQPDVLVLDLMMPGMNGLGVLAKLKQSNPQIGVVVLSMHTDLSYVRETVRLRANAYVPKDAPPEELIEAVTEAAAGRTVTSSLLPAMAGV